METRRNAWVAYVMTLAGGKAGRNAVCTQGEWEAMERTRPGHHTLIRADIASEGEAEQLARDLQTPPATPKPRPSYIELRRQARTAG